MRENGSSADLELLCLRSRCLYISGDLESSIKHLQQALRLDPDNKGNRYGYFLFILFIHLFVYLFIYLFVYLFVYLFIYLFVNLFILLSQHFLDFLVNDCNSRFSSISIELSYLCSTRTVSSQKKN